jgi:hypothetical protein
VQWAFPGTPVRIVGLKGTPPAGADLLGVEDEDRAACVLEGRARRAGAAEARVISAADALVRKADRSAYQQRRDREVAYKLAVSREYQRNSLQKAGQPIPPRLVQKPWEKDILVEARAGKIVGVVSGKKGRQQGGQQTNYSSAASAAAAGPVGEGGTGSESGEAPNPPPPIAPLLLRADTMGSLAALQDAVARIVKATDAVLPRVVAASVGEVTEKDVDYAAVMGAHIVGFGARAAPPSIVKLAEKRKVKLNVGKVIYHVLDDLCGDLGKYLPTEMEEEVVSTAEVRAVFPLKANKSQAPTAAAGCVITLGTFLKSAKTFRVARDGEVVHEAKELGSLQHLQKKVESVKKGDECGVTLTDFAGFKVGDSIQAISLKAKAQKIKVTWD